MPAPAEKVAVALPHAHEGHGGFAVKVMRSRGEGMLLIPHRLLKHQVYAANPVDVFFDIREVQDEIVVDADAKVRLDITGQRLNPATIAIVKLAVAVGGVDAAELYAVLLHIHHGQPKIARDGYDRDALLGKVQAHEADGIGLFVFVDAQHTAR